jgi:predicted  nucleic acid-binding Zn-ribbon protein
MDSKINNITQKVKSTNKDYEKFKGEFLAVNEPIINKDMMVFKIDRV